MTQAERLRYQSISHLLKLRCALSLILRHQRRRDFDLLYIGIHAEFERRYAIAERLGIDSLVPKDARS